MGFFSWITQDTNRPIVNHYFNTPFTVYMFDDEGNRWQEDNYDGYGEFGGMDYHELLDRMNGGSGNDRVRGIQLQGRPGTKYPNLAEDPNWEWRNEQPKDDPDQGMDAWASESFAAPGGSSSGLGLLASLGALFVGGWAVGTAIKRAVKNSESHDCGCAGAPRAATTGGCGCGGSQTQVHESEYSIPRVNPVAVEGAEDVYGAEGTSDPAVGGIPVSDLGGWPINRDYYQTHAGLAHPTESYYDSYNDFMPEYRFPSPWSPSYNPRDVYRGPDYTVQQVSTGGRLS